MHFSSPEILTSTFCTFFPYNMEGPRRITAPIGHLFSSTKKSKKKQKTKNKKKQTNKQKQKQKRYSLIIESLLSKNTSICFKFIMTPTRGKNMWSLLQKWNDDSYLQENQ